MLKGCGVSLGLWTTDSDIALRAASPAGSLQQQLPAVWQQVHRASPSGQHGLGKADAVVEVGGGWSEGWRLSFLASLHLPAQAPGGMFSGTAGDW